MKEIPLPKPYCASICRNSMTDLCLESCALERKGRWFELRKDLSIADMPRFPIDEFVNDMTADERKIILGSYTAKLVDQAQGVIYESRFVQRPRINDPRSQPISKDQQKQDLLPLQSEEVSPLSSTEEHSSAGIPIKTVVDSAD